MTPSQKKLVNKLLKGHFLRKVRRGAQSWYVLYDSRVNPLQKVGLKTVEKLDRFIDPKIKIWKSSKDGRVTLNLNMVRRLHGNCVIKCMYKMRSQLPDTGRIYKHRIKKSIKQTDQNEKTYCLF